MTSDKRVHVKIRVSFMGMVRGEKLWTEDGPELRTWERAGWLVIDSGQSEDRPGGPATGDPGSVHVGAQAGGPDGGEQGEDPGSG